MAPRSPPRSLNSRVRKGLLDFTRQLRKIAKESADLPSADEDDRRILEESAELLDNSAKSLIKIIETHDALVLWATDVSQDVRPEDRAKPGVLGPIILNGLVDLSSALSAAFHVGERALESPVFRQLEKDTRAARARGGREEKSRQDDRKILKLFEPLWAEHSTDWKAPRFAAEIAKAGIVNLRDNSIERKVRKLIRSRTGG